MAGYTQIAIKNYLSSYAGLPKACWREIILNLFNAISVGVCYFLALYFVDNLHFNMAIVGMMLSSYGIGTVAGGIISGKLCDKMSPRIISIISLIAQGIAFFLLAKIKITGLLTINLFFLGVSAYGFKTANYTSMLNHCRDDEKLRLKSINISHAASNFGLGLSGVIVGVMANYGYVNIFYTASAILLVSALYLALIDYAVIKKQKNNTFDSLLNQGNVSKKGNKQILILTLTSLFLIGLIIAQLGSTYPVYVKEAFPDLGTKAVSILYLLDTVLIVLFQAPLANLYSNYNKLLVMGLGAFMMGMGMLILSMSSAFILAILSCVVWTTGEMLFIPTAQLICYENGPKEKKGQSMGIFQATFAVSTVVGPTVGGFIYHDVGTNAFWYISAIIGIICFICCFAMKDYKVSVA